MVVDSQVSTDDRMNSLSAPLMAARTKPNKNNKYAKRVGAKKAKKLEITSDSSFTLNADDATTYRALSARCNYLAQDRPDLSFASKELCKQFAVPNVSFSKP